MRAVVQRVIRAAVKSEGQLVGSVGQGLCVFVGVIEGDKKSDASLLARKVAHLRIFEDLNSRMNLDVRQQGGAVLAISQFTLAGDVRKGNRPSFITAMEPTLAKEYFDSFCTELRAYDLEVQEGIFQTEMSVELVNDGPVTILLDSHRLF